MLVVYSRTMSKPYKRKDSPFYWIAPMISGVQSPRSSGTADYEEALRMIRIFEGRAALNPRITPKTDRGSIRALLELVRLHYQTQGLKSVRTVASRIDLHLVPLLGHIPGGKLSAALVGEYIVTRKKEQAHIASINRELAILKRAYVLGIEDGQVSALPPIKFLKGETAQSGFFTEDGYRAILQHANPTLHDIVIFLYWTGWRVESVIQLQWRQVDFQRGLVTRAPESGNNKATARAFPLGPFPELKTMLEWRHELTKRLEKDTRQVIPSVFHRRGEAVKSISEGWQWARRKAGLPGRKLHDFRRTAARRLLEMGYPIPLIKKMIGMASDSIFYRYAIVTEDDVLKYGSVLRERSTLAGK